MIPRWVDVVAVLAFAGFVALCVADACDPPYRIPRAVPTVPR